MQTEYEATFINVDKDAIREKLKSVGAVLVKPEGLMKRYTFNLPKGFEHKDRFVRVRDEGDKITLTFKIVPVGGAAIDEQKEICLKVDDFDKADCSQAMFCAVGLIYAQKYGVDENFINNHIEKITFDMENPFLKL